MRKLSDFPLYPAANNSDLLLIWDNENAVTKAIKKSDLLAGISSGSGGGNQPWELVSINKFLISNSKIIADCSNNTLNFNLPDSGSLQLIKLGANDLFLENTKKYVKNTVSRLKLSENLTAIELIYVNSDIGWIPSRSGVLIATGILSKYWRVRNTNSPSGSGNQWIVRELIFRDSNGIDITTGGIPLGSREATNNTVANAFDKNNDTWWDGAGAGTVNGWLRYVFPSAVDIQSISINNLNIFGNVPPTNYVVENSLDTGSTWQVVWSFTIGTNDNNYYHSAKPSI